MGFLRLTFKKFTHSSPIQYPSDAVGVELLCKQNFSFFYFLKVDLKNYESNYNTKITNFMINTNVLEKN